MSERFYDADGCEVIPETLERETIQPHWGDETGGMEFWCCGFDYDHKEEGRNCIISHDRYGRDEIAFEEKPPQMEGGA